MASVSARQVALKLGVKPGNRVAVLHSPKGYTSILAKFPARVTLTTRLAGEPFDLVQGFYEDESSLKADLRKLRKAILPSGKIWICWRKGNVTELNRDAICAFGESVGLDSVAACAIDEEWSGLKLMLPKSERKAANQVAKPALQELIAFHDPKAQKLAKGALALVRRVIPDASEEIDLPARMLVRTFTPGAYKGAIVGVELQKEYVNLIFAKGVELLKLDVEGILEGTGKFARHIKIRARDQLKSPAVRDLLEAAAALVRRG